MWYIKPVKVSGVMRRVPVRYLVDTPWLPVRIEWPDDLVYGEPVEIDEKEYHVVWTKTVGRVHDVGIAAGQVPSPDVES